MNNEKMESKKEFNYGFEYAAYVMNVDNFKGMSQKQAYEAMTAPESAMLFKLCHEMSKSEAWDCFTLTGNGLFAPGPNHEDYVQQAFAEVLSLCLESPEEDFQTLLFEGCKKALRKQFKAAGKASRYSDYENGKRVQKRVSSVSLEAIEGMEDIGQAEMMEAVENREAARQDVNRAFKAMGNRASLIFKGIAAGMTYEQMAVSAGVKVDSIYKAVTRARQAAKKAMSA